MAEIGQVADVPGGEFAAQFDGGEDRAEALAVAAGVADFDVAPRPATASVSCTARGLLAGDAAEHRADGHAEAGEVAFAEDIAGHDLSGREQVAGGLAVVHQHLRLVVHADAEIGEGDAGAQRVAVERRLVDARAQLVLFGVRPSVALPSSFEVVECLAGLSPPR